jgi:hypothetical protein
MFARTPRYGPAGRGTHVTSARGVAVQLRMSQHSRDSSFQKSASEQRILIRGFGVQVPGGAPGLTWGFTTPGHFLCVRFVHMFAPCLLGGRERGAGRLVKNGPMTQDQPSEPLPMRLHSAIAAGRSSVAGLSSVSGWAVAAGAGGPADSIRTVVACLQLGYPGGPHPVGVRNTKLSCTPWAVSA